MANLRALIDFKEGDLIYYCNEKSQTANIKIVRIDVPQKGSAITVHMLNTSNNKSFKREGYELPSQYKHIIK